MRCRHSNHVGQLIPFVLTCWLVENLRDHSLMRADFIDATFTAPATELRSESEKTAGWIKRFHSAAVEIFVSMPALEFCHRRFDFGPPLSIGNLGGEQQASRGKENKAERLGAGGKRAKELSEFDSPRRDLESRR